MAFVRTWLAKPDLFDRMKAEQTEDFELVT
jgi:hypothetical protein